MARCISKNNIVKLNIECPNNVTLETINNVDENMSLVRVGSFIELSGNVDVIFTIFPVIVNLVAKVEEVMVFPSPCSVLVIYK
jgi:hypothetical protein